MLMRPMVVIRGSVDETKIGRSGAAVMLGAAGRNGEAVYLVSDLSMFGRANLCTSVAAGCNGYANRLDGTITAVVRFGFVMPRAAGSNGYAVGIVGAILLNDEMDATKQL